MTNTDWISLFSLQSEFKFSYSQNFPQFNSVILEDRFVLLWDIPWSSNGLLVFAIKWCQTSLCKLVFQESKWHMSFRKGRLNFPIQLLMYSHHTLVLCLSSAVVLFPSLHAFWRSHTLPSTKYLGYLRDVSFVRWTLSGHEGKHRMAETSEEEAKAADNPFPVYGSGRERNGWEFSNTTGFQQNILFQQKDLIHWHGNVLQRSIFLSDPLAELRQDATEIHLLLCRLS